MKVVVVHVSLQGKEGEEELQVLEHPKASLLQVTGRGDQCSFHYMVPNTGRNLIEEYVQRRYSVIPAECEPAHIGRFVGSFKDSQKKRLYVFEEGGTDRVWPR